MSRAELALSNVEWIYLLQDVSKPQVGERGKCISFQTYLNPSSAFSNFGLE